MSHLVFRFVATALFVFACGLIGSKILTQSTTLEFESSELTLRNFPFGEDRNLSFRVHNQSFLGAAKVVGILGAVTSNNRTRCKELCVRGNAVENDDP